MMAFVVGTMSVRLCLRYSALGTFHSGVYFDRDQGFAALLFLNARSLWSRVTKSSKKVLLKVTAPSDHKEYPKSCGKYFGRTIHVTAC